MISVGGNISFPHGIILNRRKITIAAKIKRTGEPSPLSADALFNGNTVQMKIGDQHIVSVTLLPERNFMRSICFRISFEGNQLENILFFTIIFPSIQSTIGIDSVSSSICSRCT